jgi:hypothetical protein
MIMHILRHLRVASLLIAVAPVYATAQVKVDAGHRAAPDCSIRLQGPIATVRVTGWDRDSIAVSGSLPKGARLDNMFGNDPGLALRGVKMLVEGAPGQVRPSGIIELRVPFGARVVIHTGSSDIEVTGLTGELDITMLGGSARVSASPRILSVDAIYATIALEGSPERVRLKSFEGDITMRGGSLNAEFSTAQGNIRVGGGLFDRAKFDATTGSVSFSGDLMPTASFLIGTHSAPVELLLSLKANVVVEATTSTGTIENSFTKQEPSTGPGGKGQHVSTGMGKGAARIVIESYKGNVRIQRRHD